MMGAHEFQSFETILNPECSELSDFFKFIFIEWKNEFYTLTDEEKEQVNAYKEKLLKEKEKYEE